MWAARRDACLWLHTTVFFGLFRKERSLIPLFANAGDSDRSLAAADEHVQAATFDVTKSEMWKVAG